MPAQPQTITEKLLAAHCGRETVHPGEIVNAEIDLVVAHEVTTPPAIKMLAKLGITKVFDPKRIVVTPDHFVPNKDIQTAQLTKELREWAIDQGIERYYELGNHGICHALIPEKGHILPGMTAVCADSHTTTLGAFGAFATGIGSTDLAAVLATGELWFKVPETLRFELEGELPEGVYAKDLMLYIISKIGVDGARYAAMEFTGSTIDGLSMEGRMTLCNMAIEAGGKTGIIAADSTTKAYLAERGQTEFKIFASDLDATFAQNIRIQADELEPIVALPHLPSNGRFIGDVEPMGIKVDQAYIGSCTNARIEDLRIAAQILKGRTVARGTRTMVVPATSDIWRQALREGLLEIFADAGCVVSTATCGACLGGHMGVLGAGEKCISSTNRNFVGRMGSPKSEVYLASPATVAASALTGVITDPRPFLNEELRMKNEEFAMKN
ncbi:MAG TPA: 3-isopropylmalate dehydratase large subunit [Acidobacteriota bacterium]|nr:3-isopropylmalate dehydratase large subunit [Acidobacteriota bacterium]HNJ42563.1 3-isopropylmalate dehydratase large subunit [Acidobacteriota bacterium]